MLLFISVQYSLHRQRKNIITYNILSSSLRWVELPLNGLWRWEMNGSLTILSNWSSVTSYLRALSKINIQIILSAVLCKNSQENWVSNTRPDKKVMKCCVIDEDYEASLKLRLLHLDNKELRYPWVTKTQKWPSSSWQGTELVSEKLPTHSFLLIP